MFWKRKDKKEIKSLGKSVTWDEWDKCELLPAVHSHIISVYSKGNRLRNFVVPGLVDLDVVFKDDVVDLVIHDYSLEPHLDVKTNDDETFMICMSDDPTMEFAGDWTQMGCMRIFFVAYEPKYKFYKKKLIVTCDVKNFVIRDSYNEVSVDKVTA